MLQTTVNYLNLIESRRHNLVTEKQTDADLAIKQGELEVHKGQLAETSRHNLVTESQGWASILETSRHNLVTESVQKEQLQVNWFDANTRRYSAVQQAGIGWANVAVNQGQLEVAQRRVNNDFVIGMSKYQTDVANAEVNETNATTRQEELSHKIDYDSNMLNINQQNADTNRLNALSRQTEVAIDKWKTSIESDKQKTNKVKTFSTELREWFKVMPDSEQTKFWWTIFPPG